MKQKNFPRKRWIEMTIYGLAALALLAGCGGGEAPAPGEPAPQNVDPNLVYTSGAQTVVAQLTVDAASRPQPTQAPPTAAPLPTLAPLPSADGTQEGIIPGGEPLPGAAQPTAGAGLPLPTMSPLGATPAGGVIPAATASNVYVAEWLSQTPIDGSRIGRGQAFTMHWRVLNKGTATWTKSFQLRFYAGTQMTTTAVVNFPSECAPGKDIDLSVRMTPPTAPGDYTSVWVLSTPDGRNFYTVTIQITVP